MTFENHDMGLIQKLSWLLDQAILWGARISGASIVLMVSLVSVEVVSRQFGISIPGTIEVATFALVTSVFFALPYTLCYNEHIRVGIILENVGRKTQRILNLVSLSVASVTTFWLAYYTHRLTMDSFKFGDMSNGLLAIPLWIPQSTMPIGIGLLGLTFCRELLLGLKQPNRKLFENQTFSKDA